MLAVHSYLSGEMIVNSKPYDILESYETSLST